MTGNSDNSPDIAVIGGGLLGASIAYGMARQGAKVTVFDEGDIAFRASRANFALVWVQTKGLGMPEYSAWSMRSADAWAGLSDMLLDETGIDVGLERPGGFSPSLSDAEMQAKINVMRRLHNLPGTAALAYEVLDRDETARRLPGIGPDVVGSIYSPADGHVNSLKFFRALHVAMIRSGVTYRPFHPVDSIEKDGAGFVLRGAWGQARAGKVVLAAGIANQRLGPMVGLNVPMRPLKGQILVTEKTTRFLNYPLAALRQTDEGGVMIGDSQEDMGLNTVVTTPILSVMASRAARMFPRIAQLNVVRTWSALRPMTKDGFPIYEQSQTHPGAFVAVCHSGVTLAANHVLTLAPALVQGVLPDFLSTFHSRRFDVPATV